MYKIEIVMFLVVAVMLLIGYLIIAISMYRECGNQLSILEDSIRRNRKKDEDGADVQN